MKKIFLIFWVLCLTVVSTKEIKCSRSGDASGVLECPQLPEDVSSIRNNKAPPPSERSEEVDQRNGRPHSSENDKQRNGRNERRTKAEIERSEQRRRSEETRRPDGENAEIYNKRFHLDEGRDGGRPSSRDYVKWRKIGEAQRGRRPARSGVNRRPNDDRNFQDRKEHNRRSGRPEGRSLNMRNVRAYEDRTIRFLSERNRSFENGRENTRRNGRPEGSRALRESRNPTSSDEKDGENARMEERRGSSSKQFFREEKKTPGRGEVSRVRKSEEINRSEKSRMDPKSVPRRNTNAREAENGRKREERSFGNAETKRRHENRANSRRGR